MMRTKKRRTLNHSGRNLREVKQVRVNRRKATFGQIMLRQALDWVRRSTRPIAQVTRSVIKTVSGVRRTGLN